MQAEIFTENAGHVERQVVVFLHDESAAFQAQLMVVVHVVEGLEKHVIGLGGGHPCQQTDPRGWGGEPERVKKFVDVADVVQVGERHAAQLPFVG